MVSGGSGRTVLSSRLYRGVLGRFIAGFLYFGMGVSVVRGADSGVSMLCEVPGIVFSVDCYGFIAEETQWFILKSCEKVLRSPFIFENTVL
jgi:hypothetical protein